MTVHHKLENFYGAFVLLYWTLVKENFNSVHTIFSSSGFHNLIQNVILPLGACNFANILYLDEFFVNAKQSNIQWIFINKYIYYFYFYQKILIQIDYWT